MNTRTIATATAPLALLSVLALTPHFATGASAAPPSGEPPRHIPTTTVVGPTTIPENIPVFPPAERDKPSESDTSADFDTHAPEPTPVTTLQSAADDHLGNPTTSPNPIEIEPGLAPEPEYLAPCGVAPYNLEPIGPIRAVDMSGDGTADDRLSIRAEKVDGAITHLLHLELSSGERSEVPIPDFDGQTPSIDFIVQLDRGIESSDHPAPSADEAIVGWGTLHSADSVSRFFDLYGTDERGCISRYSFLSPPQGLLFALNDNGRSGFECDESRNLTRTRVRPFGNKWSFDREQLVRHDATTVFAQAPSGTTLSSSELPFLGPDC